MAYIHHIKPTFSVASRSGIDYPAALDCTQVPRSVRAAQTFRMSAGAFLCFDACEQVSKSVYGAILCGHCASMFSHACRHGICTRGDLYTYMSNIMLIHVCVHRWSATTGPSPCTRRALKQAETRLPEPAVLLRYVRISVHACVSFCHMFSLVSREKATQVACSAASAAAARSADTPRGLLRAPGTSAPGGGQTAYTKRGVGF